MGTNYESVLSVLLAGVEALLEEIHHRDPVSTDESIEISSDCVSFVIMYLVT
jgi:predicted transcriptional regulator